MGRVFAAALVAGAISASFSTAQAATIGIDFGCGANVSGSINCVTGDAPLQSGYSAWSGPHLEVPLSYNVTRSLTADFGVGGSFNLNVTSDALYFRDYANIETGGPYEGQSDLLSDNINLNQPGTIEFTFSGLTAGTYSMESFHHSTFAPSTVLFDIIVEDLLGTRTVVSGANTSRGTYPTSIAALLYELTVGADGTATVTFGSSFIDYGLPLSINGFQLTDVAPVPLPAAAWLLLSALGGLGFAGWRRKRVAA